MDMNEATAKALQAERAIADITVRELSKQAGIPLSSLMRVLGAERDIKVNQVAQLATALGVYPHEIIERAETILARADRAATGNAEVVHLPVRPVSDVEETIPDAADDAAGTHHAAEDEAPEHP